MKNIEGVYGLDLRFLPFGKSLDLRIQKVGIEKRSGQLRLYTALICGSGGGS